MKKTITARVEFIVQDRTDADDADRVKYRHPDRPFELMDADNCRHSFVRSVDHAARQVRAIVEESLDIGFNTSDIEIN